MKVLVVAAHPDDEVLGCGGTIAKLAQAGHFVHILILGEGLTSRFEGQKNTDKQALDSLHAEARRASEVLGATEIVINDFPDNRFDTVPLLNVVKVVEEFCHRLKPAVIYTHAGGDLNVDHGVTHKAVLTATRPTSEECVREIYSFEVPSSTDWAFQKITPVFRPSVFEDISETIDVKKRALSCYSTESRMFPHPRSAEAMGAVATRWGSTVGREAAEAFELVRAIR